MKDIENAPSPSSLRTSGLHLGMTPIKNHHTTSPSLQKSRMMLSGINSVSASPSNMERTTKTLGYKRKMDAHLIHQTERLKETEGEDDDSPLPLAALNFGTHGIDITDGIFDIDCDAIKIVKDSVEWSHSSASCESEEGITQKIDSFADSNPLQFGKRNSLTFPSTPFRKDKRFKSQERAQVVTMKHRVIADDNDEDVKSDTEDV
jgi:hypothetical protein